MHLNGTARGGNFRNLRLLAIILSICAILSEGSPLLAQDLPSTWASLGSGSYVGARDLYLQCSSFAGCNATYYCAGTGCTPTTPYTGVIAISASTDISYYSTDRGGNTEPVRTAHYTITPDTAGPVTGVYPGSGTYGPISIGFYCDDKGGSGCRNIYYCLGAGCTPTTQLSPYSTVSITASTEVSFYSDDKAGNAGAITTASYVRDTTPPVTSATPAAGSYHTPPVITLSCDAGGGTGCGSTYYCLGKGCSPTTWYTAPITISDSTDLRFYSRDDAGNAETVVTQSYLNGHGGPRVLAVPSGYATIQSAIDVAFGGDTVSVAPGTYRENLDFKGRNITVSSRDGAEVTVIDGDGEGTAVTFKSGEGRGAVLSGFTIRNGGAYNDAGGIRVSHASPTIINNTITGNYSNNGAGGVDVDSGSPAIRNNVITGNFGYYGGGIYIGGAASAEVTGNVISENRASYGAGITLWSPGTPLIRGNVVRDNVASARGGGIAIYNSSSATFLQNLITGNRASEGAAINGGTSSDSFINNTIVDNESLTGASAVLRSAAFINNIVTSGSNKPAVSRDGAPFSHNIVYAAGGSAYDGTDQNGINGNITADPRLGAPRLGYFGLLPGSPAIDAGDGSAALPDTDLAGGARVLDGNADGTGAPDIGAYELDPGAPFAEVGGIPGEQLKADSLTLTVGGSGVVSYRYSLDGGPFSGSDVPVANPITLSSLANGRHSIAVLGKNAAGREQQLASASAATWVVNTEASDLTFTSGGDSAWFMQTDVSRDGIAYQNGAVGAGQSSWMETTVTGPGAIRFWWKGSDTSYSSRTVFSIDGSTQGSIGHNTYWQYSVFAVGSGRHTVRWSHSVDYASRPPAAVWLDGISFVSGTGLDLTLPTTTATPDGGTFAATQTVTLSCADNGACSGTFYCLGWGCDPVTPYAGPITIDTGTSLNFYSTDSAGNAEAVQSKGFSFDRTAPTTYASPAAGSYLGARDVALTCYDASLGCLATYWCLGSDCTPSTPYTAPVPVTASGVLRYYSVDKGGNAQQVRSESYTILADVTPPTTLPNPAPGISSPVAVSFYCNDSDGSGCAATYYCLGSGCDPTTRASGSFTLTASTQMSYYSVDRSGNAERVHTASYTIDGAPPVTTPSVAGGIHPGPQRVSLSCDGTGSGCSYTNYCVGTSTCYPDTRYSGPIDISSTGYLAFSSVDAAGNYENTRKIRYNIVDTPPSTRNVPSEYPTVQGAIDAAGDGDTVLVAPGTYRENIDFKGKAITVQGSGGAEATVIDGGRNGAVVTFSSGEWTNSVLTGFTIRNGAAQAYGQGGGVFIRNASPSVIGNRITANQACSGAGIYLSGDAVIRGNTISGNSQQGCGSGYGGGIHLSQGSAAIVDNTIEENGGNDWYGGGIYVAGWGANTIRGNVIRNNGAAGGSGGGVYLANSSGTELVQNVVTGNRAGSGGGLYIAGSGRVLNNTVADNDAPYGSAIYLSPLGVGVIANNILTGKKGQTVIWSNGPSYRDPALTRNVLFSPSGTVFGGSYQGDQGEGNTIGDPLLAGAPFGYCGLLAGSPAIDAADGSVAGLPATDVTGAPRVLAGTPGGDAVLDAGAFEYDPGQPRAEIVEAPAAATRESTATVRVGGAGIASYRYAVDGGTFSADTPVATPIVLGDLSPGTHFVAVTGTSEAGTQRAASASVAHWNVDAVPPVTTAAPAGGVFTEAQSVTLSCDDGSGSGCAATFYCLGADCTPTTPYSAPFTVDSSAGVRYFSRDLFGHEERVHSSSYGFTATVSGRVKDSVTGAALPFASVTAYDAATGFIVSMSDTDSSGSYALQGLPPGSYKFRFSSSGYLASWYGGAADRSSAQPVSVPAPGTTAGIDGALVPGGSITGAVTDSETGAPLQGVYVSVYDAAGSGSYASTDSSGGYLLTGLPTGTYTVKFYAYNSGYVAGSYSSAVSVTAGSVTSGIDGKLYKGGSITGTVTDSAGVPLAGVSVSATDAATGAWGGYATTDSSGRYTLAGLSGSYHLSFYATAYIHAWYAGTPTEKGATAVSVAANGVTSGIDMALTKGGTITGTATDSVSGAGVANVSVMAIDAITGQYVAGQSTDGSGRYSISGLPAGSYKLRFDASGYLSQWSGGGTDQAGAASVAVAAAATVAGVDARLGKGGSISGTVTDRRTGSALQGIMVHAYSPEGIERGSGLTDLSGRYTIDTVPSGSYTVGASDLSRGYHQQWYRDPGSSAARTVSVVVPNAVQGIDLALEQGGAITGTVTDRDTGAAVQFAYVSAYDAATGKWASDGQSDASGRYAIYPVPTGSYKLRFTAPGYLPQWSGGKERMADAAAVAATAPVTTSGVDADLSRGGQISGAVADSRTGVAIPNVSVYAVNSATGSWAAGATTDDNGRYTLNELPSGSYRLRVDPPYYSSYIARWYGSGCADTVSVSAPGATTGADILLDAGGSVSGRVTDAATGAGISGARILLHGAGPMVSAPTPTTDETGSYTIAGLSPGTYRLFFSAPRYISGADPVVVAVSGTEGVAGIDARLHRGGSISGRVTDDSTGAAIPGVVVEAVDSTTNMAVAMANADILGNFVVSGLPSGGYRLFMDGRTGSTGYASASYDAGGGITVTAPDAVSGISVTLAREGAIAGTVYDESSAMPLSDVSVVAHDADTGAIVGNSFTDGVGNYTIQVGEGSFLIEFLAHSGEDGGYLGRWYQSGADTGASRVVVRAQERVRLPLVALSRGGGITGHATVESCPAPSVIAVTAYDAQTGREVMSTYVSTYYGTAFSIGGLPAGSYKILFDPQESGFLRQWYPNKGDFASASAITVTAGRVTDGVDLTLASGGAAVSGALCTPWYGKVRLYDWYSGGLVAQATPSPGGFLFSGIADGTYKVLFSLGAEGRWFRDAGETGAASPVVVSGGVAVSGVGLTQGCPDGVVGTVLQPGVADALAALRMAVGIVAATPELLSRYDVGPVSGGVSVPDGLVDISDAIILLRLAVGLPVFTGGAGAAPAPASSSGSGFTMQGGSADQSTGAVQ